MVTFTTSTSATLAQAYAATESHTITVVYAGDANYTTSTSAGLTQTVSNAATTTTLGSSSNPSVSGQAVTYTATVTANVPGSGTPAGTVTFKDGGVSIGVCTAVALAGGIATCVQTYTASGGSHAMTVVYAGDTNYSTSTPAVLTQNINKDATTTAVGSSVNPSSAGQAVTFTATVSANAPGSGTPAGTLTFQDGGVNIAGCVNVTLVAGSVTCGQTYATAGAHPITAIYAGDTNSSTSTSGTLTQTVNAGATTTTVMSGTNPSVFGQPVTYTATVIGSAPTGTVTFMDGAAVLGTGAVAGGIATYSMATLSVAGSPHSITAVYGGDGNNGGSTSSAVAQTVNKDATSTALVSSANPSVGGQAVTYTATVSVTAPGAGAPAGTVTFKDAGVAIVTCTTVALTGVVATCVQTYAVVGSHPITAVYTGDGNENTSTSPGVIQAVNPAATTTVVVSSANPSVSGQAVTYTATVAVTAPGSGTPANGDAVTFKDGAATICATTLSGGVATCGQTYAASGGSHGITVVFGGDGNFTGSTSAALTQSVSKDGTATALSSSVNPSAVGQSTTYTATVTAAAPGSGIPAATVTFQDGGVNIAVCVNVVLAAGSAPCVQTYATVGAGTHTITAIYGGDANFAGSTSAGLTQTVTQAAATTAVAASVDPSVSGQNVTFTATVTGVTPTGTVTFMDGAVSLGTGTLNGSFQATLATPALSVGGSPHSITAVYGPDANNTGSTSPVLLHTVNQDATAATVTSSVNPSVDGQAVTYTATVTANAPGGGTPTGTVTFQDGGADIGGCAPVALASGVAACGQTYGGAGGHTITAIYGGDTGYAGSTSPALNQVVDAGALAPSTTALSSSLNPSAAGQAVTYTATVSGIGPVPSGTVAFTDSASAIAGCAGVSLDGAATATCVVSYGAAGSHPVTATYGGDGNYTSSVSATVTQTVNPAGSATALASTLNPSAYGDSVTFTATVTGAGDMPTGTATFKDGAGVLGSGALDGSGMATYTTSALITATHAITVVYVGDANYTGSTSGVVSQVVNRGATSTVLTSDANPSVFGQSVTFTAVVSGNGASVTGNVTFSDGATPLATIALSGGTAAVAVATLGAGTHVITAVYAGDANNIGGTSNAVSQDVTSAGSATVLTSSVNPSGFGQPVTFTATVGGTGGVADGSTVTFMDGAVAIGATTTTGGSATLTTAALSAASHAVTAVFAGDADHSGSTSNTVTQVVAVENSSTVVATSGSPSTYATAVTFTATVSGASGTPTGTVIFTDSASSTTATVAVDGSGQAQWTVATLDAGARTIGAAYSGDGSNTPSAGSVAQTVVPAASATAVTTSVTPSLYAQNVTFTATVGAAGGIPDGATVSFSYGGGPLGSGTTTAGVATLTTSALPVGAGQTITAAYAGDTDRGGSSGTVAQTVTLASSSTDVTTSQTPSVYAAPVTFTATVTGAGGIPDGVTVTFTDGAQPLGTATTSSGIAAVTTAALPVGAGQTITASYPGDAGHTGSTGTVAQDVGQAGSGTGLTTSQTPSAYGGTVTFTATITGAGGIPDLGTVSFDNGAQHLGTTATASGVATLTTTALPVGAGQNVTATYAGDAGHTGSSGSVSQDVDTAVAAGTITTDGSPSVYAGTVTFTVTAVPSGAGATPTGTVDVMDGATALCAGVVLSGGVATCATATLGSGAHTITAAYSGDGNYAAATPLASVAQAVGQAASTTTLASSANPAGRLQVITFTATVSGPGGAMTGTVTFDDGGSAIGSGTVGGGNATYSTVLAVGSHDITAVYSGDGNYSGGGSAILTQAVTTATAVIAAPSSTVNPSVVGQSVTLGTTVSGAGATPTGTIEFDAGGSPIPGCTGIALAGGAASCATTILAAPSDTVTAVYSGDAGYGPGSSPPMTQVVDPSAASISQPSSSLNASTYGASVTFATSVAGGGPIPTGTVDFQADGSTIPGCGAQPLDAGGTAVCTTAATLGGSHAVIALYSGDTNYTPVASAPLTQSVNPAATVPSITSGGPSAFGQTVTFTVTVPGGGVVPTGTVAFFDNGTPLGSGGLDGAGDATFSTNSLIAGTHPVTGTYGGDGNYAVATTGAYDQVVFAGTATVNTPLSTSPSSVYGTGLTFSTTVTGTLTIPAGTVAFRDGGVTLPGCGAAVLDGAGDASCALSVLLDAGSHSITAVYSGDANYAPTVSAAALDQEVAPGPTGTTLTTSGTPSVYDTVVTITATVTGAGATPAGTVTLTDSDGGATATLALDGAGHARWAIASFGVLTHHLTAAYAGDADNSPSASAVLAQTITAAASVTTLGSSANPSTHGRMVTFTATVTGPGATPAGTVTFSDGGTPLGSASAVNGSGTATYSLATLGTGAHDITAAYSGDGSHGTSTSTTLAQVVGRVATTTVVTSSASPSSSGQRVTFTATVAGSAPTGTVAFADGAATLGTATLNGAFQAAYGVSTLSVAGSPHRITAVYRGDANNGGSTSAPASQTVTSGSPSPDAVTATPGAPSPGAGPAAAVTPPSSPTPAAGTATAPASGRHSGQAPQSGAGSGFFGLAGAVGSFASIISQHWVVSVFATMLLILLSVGIPFFLAKTRRRRHIRRHVSTPLMRI